MEKQIQEQTFLNQVYIPEGMNVLLDEIARVHRLVNGNQHRRKKSDILIQAFQRLGGMDYLQGELAAAQIALQNKPVKAPGRRGRRKKVVE